MLSFRVVYQTSGFFPGFGELGFFVGDRLLIEPFSDTLENNQFMTIVYLYQPIIVQLCEKSYGKLTSNLSYVVHRFHSV